MSAKVKKLWSVLADRFVAVIKIVDYKKIKAENSERDFFEKVLYIRNIIDNPDQDLVKAFIIDDTIFLFTRHTGNNCLIDIFGKIMRIQILLFDEGIATKGGLAEGRVLAGFDTMTFAGDALTAACDIAEQINIYAVAQNEQNAIYYESNSPERTAEDIPLEYPMEVPTQNGKVKMKVINSVMFSKEKDAPETLLSHIKDKPFYADTLATFKEIHAYSYLD